MRLILATLFLGSAITALAQPILADSVLDFSGVQGANGWTYRFYDKTSDSTPESYELSEAQLMGQYIADHEKWYAQEGTYWTMLGKVSAHSNGTLTSGGRAAAEQFAIRRWTSSYTGVARIRGEIAKINFTGGNGVQAHLKINGQAEFTTWIAGDDFIGTTFSIDRPVQAGDAIEWWFDSYQSNDLYDLSYYTGSVAAVPEPSAAIAIGIGLAGLFLRLRRR